MIAQAAVSFTLAIVLLFTATASYLGWLATKEAIDDGEFEHHRRHIIFFWLGVLGLWIICGSLIRWLLSK
jgi:hypothetical protein